MHVLTYSEARANLKDVMGRVVDDHDQVIVTRQKAEAVVMVSLSDWNAIEETLHLLSTRGNFEALRDSIRAADAGEVEEHDLIEP
jgi:antitoxin YefM